MERTQQMFDGAKDDVDQPPQRAQAKTRKNDSLEQQIVAPPKEAQFDADATLPPTVAGDGSHPDKRVTRLAQAERQDKTRMAYLSADSRARQAHGG